MGELLNSPLGLRIGALTLAGALLFSAWRLHGSRGRISQTITQNTAVILAFLAGCAFLVTVLGDWASSLAAAAPWLPAAIFLVLLTIILVDWLNDGRADKGAFFAMLLMPIVIAIGFGQLGRLWDQVGEGASQVGTEIGQVGAEQ